MPRHAIRSTLKDFLEGVWPVFPVIAGLSFFFGGRAIHDFGGVDRTLAEMIGIGVAFLCLILGAIGKYKVEDIEWQEQNEEAKEQQRALEKKMNEPRA